MGSKSTPPPSIPIPAGGRLGALLRVPVDYILEVYINDVISASIALPHSPSEYSQTRPSATVLTHTLGDVIREITQNHLVEITLGGSSGFSPRTGQTRTGGVSVLGGRRIMEEFDAFLDDYQKRAAHAVDLVYMVFRALNEKQAYRVEPMSWEWSLDASQNRFSYRWGLTLEAYAPAPADPRGSVFSPVTEAVRAITDYVAAGAGAIALADNALTNVGAEFEEVRTLLRSLSRISGALERAAASADGITQYFTTDLPSTWALLAASYKRAWAAVKELSPEKADDAASGYSGELLNYRALVSAGLSGSNDTDLANAAFAPLIELEERRAGLTDSAPTLSRGVTLRAGDDVRKIAARAYGSSDRWVEIAEYNGLRSATHWGDGRPLQVGDVLLVPFAQSSEMDFQLPPRGDLFGVDLAVSVSGDLELTREGDLLRRRGRQNLEQALRLRLLTEQGSARAAPQYGLPLTIGGALTARVVAFCASHIDQQIRADSRVDDVRDIIIEEEGDALSVSALVSPVQGGALNFVIPIRRA